MAEVTWANLAKSVDDNTKISDEIDSKILAHNEDPSAHGQLGEGIYNHRVGEILDHLDESVINAKLLKMARAYKFIVDPAGNGDYTDIQSAIDAAHADGGGRILIKAGTYTLAANLTLYSDIELVGDDDDDTIIDFNSTEYYISAVGTSTVPLVNIHLRNLQVRNSSQVDYGAVRLDYVNDSSIEDCYFTGNERDIYMLNCYRLLVTRCRFISSGDAICGSCFDSCFDFNYSENSSGTFVDGSGSGISRTFISRNRIYHPTGMAIVLNANSSDDVIVNNIMTYNVESGMYIAASATLIMGNSFDGEHLGDTGIWLATDVTVTRIVDNYFYRLEGDGVYLYSGCDQNIIEGNVFYSISDSAVYISSSTCDLNIVLGNVFRGITGADITNNGTGTEIAHNTSV